jgi:hypothetical protein
VYSTIDGALLNQIASQINGASLFVFVYNAKCYGDCVKNGLPYIRHKKRGHFPLVDHVEKT